MKMNTFTKVRVDEQLLHEIKEVRETLAVDVELGKKQHSTFCVADLWKIHKQKRQRAQRRFL